MFFYLSKLLLFLITPLIWIIFLLIWAILTKKPKRKKRLFITTVLLLFIFSNSFLVDELFRAWEYKTTAYEEIIEPYDYGIVLGGMMSYDSKYNRINTNRSFDRLVQAIELYKKGKIKKIFISGGSGSILEPELFEGKLLMDFLIRIGIPKRDIFQESVSRNTRENAIFTKLTMDSLNRGKVKTNLLITSAFHMKRAIACFEKAGLNVSPFVTDRYVGDNKKYVFDHMFIPNIEAFQKFTLITREFIGYLMYSMVGYI